jgi:hypothetical protein
VGNPAFIVIGVVAIILAITTFVRRDWWWQITQWGNEADGVRSERTGLWEWRMAALGAFGIVLGIACIWLGIAN